LKEIQHRYALIGRSPLTEITMEQARLVEVELAASGNTVPVYVGMRNWRPYIPDVVKQMRADGIEEFAVICMAPQNSRTSVGLYRRAVEAESSGLRVDFTEGWAQHPLLAQASPSASTGLDQAKRSGGRPGSGLVHSAQRSNPHHPAPRGQRRPTSPLARRPGRGPLRRGSQATPPNWSPLVLPEIPRWWFAFQSQGASGGPWIGPSVEETLESIAADGIQFLILQPIGFLCDHVEILFDVDILFHGFAVKLGVRLERPESLNASVTLARAVADLARRGLERLNG